MDHRPVVRLKDKNTGHEFTGIDGVFDDTEVIDKDAVDEAGKPLPAKPKNRRPAARTAGRAVTKPTAKKAAAKRTTPQTRRRTPTRTAASPTPGSPSADTTEENA